MSFPLKPTDMWTDNNRTRTRALFEEECTAEDSPVACLERSKLGLDSLHDVYISTCVDDPSEATFIDKAFDGDFHYWSDLKEAKWIQSYLDRWREESDIRRKGKAFKTLIDEVKDKGKNAVTSAKYLISEPYKAKTTSVRKQTNKTKEAAKSEFAADIHRLKDYAK